jgi:serine/threonine protein kinase/tetratricopeptide (TPR) repeat protein
MPADRTKARELFLHAVGKLPPDGWDAYVAAASGGDVELEREVADMLRVHREAGSFLSRPALGATGVFVPASSDGPDEAEQPGTAVGPYKLIERIGEGGMGAVWLAEQQEPVRRRVALKVVKAGMDSRQVLARFEAERQALALMDHPNIARVLDTGAAPSGRPYFVMELVKGTPITNYCDEHRLTPQRRLGLFVQVCQAVQHAHQKGVIHRDLKPSNVLVAPYDGEPVVKVIDFGVAKAVGEPLTERTLVTGLGAVIGTPEYMSPEQAELNNRDIDTRSDVYSLGVLLYELLTGTTPLTRERVREATLLEVLRLVREEDAPKPSSRLSTTEGLPRIAADRGLEPRRLSGLVRGELDWIVMRCLEKDRGRRYQTASTLAADVQRYLADEPVEASPPSTAYRVRKFVRRNRGPVVAAFLVALTLVGGIVGTTVGLVRAEERAKGEQRAKESAEKRLAQIERGIDLLGLMFEDLDPFEEEKEGRPLRVILGDRLDRAAASLEGEAVGDPLVVARLQDRLGQTYLGLGHAAKAEELFTKAVMTRQAHLGTDHPDTLASRHNQALAYHTSGKPTEAIRQFEQVWDARVRVLGGEHPDTLTTLHYMAVAYSVGGKENDVIPLLEQVRDGRVKQLGEHHEHTLQTIDQLARAYLDKGKHPEAIRMIEQVRNAQVKKYGEEHPRAIEALFRLAGTYQASFKMKPALTLLEQARDLAVPKLGPEHPLTLRILQSLGTIYRAYHRTAEAIALLEHVRQKRVMLLGGHHRVTLNTLFQLALAYQDAGELDKALPLLQEAAAGVERLQFAWSTGDSIVPQLCFLHERLKQFDQAEVWRRKWLAVIKVRDGPGSGLYVGLRGLAGLGWNLLKQQKYAEAEPILRESLAILEKIEPGEWTTCYTQALLGGALLGQQKYSESEPLLVDGYQGMRKTGNGRGHSYTSSRTPARVIETLERLVQLYDAMNKPDEAAKWRMELEAFTKETEAVSKPKDK